MAKVTPVVAQPYYRGRRDDGTETTATWLAAENTAWSQPIDVPFRVRFTLDETAGANAKSATFDLLARLNAGAWVSVTPTGPAFVKAVASAHVPNETLTTRQLTAPTGTFQAGWVVDDGITPAQTINAGNFTEHEYVVRLDGAGVAVGDTVDFMIRYGDATALEGASVPASLTAAPAPPTLSLVSKTDTSVELAWTAVTGATSYLVQQSAGGANAWGTIANTAELTLVKTGLTASTRYDFRVSADGGTTWSSVLAVTTSDPPDPSDLTVAQSGVDVVLTWPAPAMAGATHTAVFRRAGTTTEPFTPTPETELARVPIATLTYTDVAPPVGDYAYQVFPLTM